VRFAALIITTAAAAALAACSAIPRDTTAQAATLQGVWSVFLPAALVVYALVGGLIVYAAVAYRRRGPDTPQAASFHKNVPLELTWTVVPVLVVTGLFAVTYAAERHVESVVTPPAETVQVVGFRWSWRFLYPREHVAVEGTSDRPPELVLPAGRTTEIRLTSTDVIHAFWVPAFLFKRDAIPGIVNVYDYTPLKEGLYPGRCAEYCGTFHAHMSFTVRVVSPAAFDRWVQERGASA
jgi:cytochrome c oxidase subunit II